MQAAGHLGKSYLVSGSASYQQDDKSGNTGIVKLAYQARPWERISSEGRYSLETVTTRVDLDAFQGRPAYAQYGAAKCDVLLFRWLSFSYRPDIEISRLKAGGRRFYDAKNNQMTLRYALSKYLQSELSYDIRITSFVNAMRGEQALNSSVQKANKINWRNQTALWSYLSLSTEMAAGNEHTVSRLDTGMVSLRERDGKNRNWSVNLSCRDLLAADVAMGYYGESVRSSSSDSIESIYAIHKVNNKITHRLNKYFTVNGGFGYSRKAGQDPVVSTADQHIIVHSFAPNFGLTVKPLALVFFEGNYEYSRSSGDALTILETLRLQLVSNHRNFQLNIGWQLDKSRDPDYIISDVRAS
ncbi:MAG: hypothetical protein QME74_01310, partial [Candidatus Edwardsbacteria bacterium]|nr:hypothetical protein [Candidatus Edwardsbacteria bacterium]